MVGFVPDISNRIRISTENVSVLDAFDSIPLSQLRGEVDCMTVKTSHELIGLLRKAVESGRRSALAPGLGVNRSDIEGNIPGATAAHPDHNPPQFATGVISIDIINFMTQMTYLRSILMQAMMSGSGNANYRDINVILEKEFPAILSLSSADPVVAVTTAFSGIESFNGVQHEVLKNLLKDGDVAFLEKICLRLWKQFRANPLLCVENSNGALTSTAGDAMHFTAVPVNMAVAGDTHNMLCVDATSYINLVSLAGEVVVSETKVIKRGTFMQ